MKAYLTEEQAFARWIARTSALTGICTECRKPKLRKPHGLRKKPSPPRA